MNYKKFLISIIVPIYNAENYLTKCINSIINQTYKNIEIILVNDGSTDNSLKICKTFALNDKRIIIINQKNMGVSNARNAGINVAKGDYISFVDSDDTIENNYIQELIDNSNYGEFDVVICGYNDIYASNKKIENKMPQNIKLRGFISNDYVILKRYLSYPWHKIYKVNFLKKHNINFSTQFTDAEDQVFNFKVFSLAPNYNFVNKTLYNYYHVNSNSLSKQYTIRSFNSNLKKLQYEKTFLEENRIYNKEKFLNDSAFWLMNKYVVVSDISDNYVNFKSRVDKIKLLMYKCEKFRSFKRYVALYCLKNNFYFIIYVWYLLKYLKR